MARKRLTGTIDGVEVRTEWLEDAADGQLDGMRMSAEARGWQDVTIETDGDGDVDRTGLNDTQNALLNADPEEVL